MALEIHVAGTPHEHPIDGVYVVDPDGTVPLGPIYGRVRLNGATIATAEAALVEHLKSVLRDPRVQVTHARYPVQHRRVPVPADPYHIAAGDVLAITVIGTYADAAIADDYVVEPSGSVALGPMYGRAKVAGLTLEDAEKVVTEHLQKQVKDPKVQITLGGWRDIPQSSRESNRPRIASSRIPPTRSIASMPNQTLENRANPEEVEALREHVKFLENHFRMAVAQGELEKAEGRSAEAAKHFEEAEQLAEQALIAIEAAHSAGVAKHDLLLQAAKNLSESKRRLIEARRHAQSFESSENQTLRDVNAALRELAQSTPAPSATESIGVLRKMVERAKQDYERVQPLAKEHAISTAELARVKSDYEISIERLRQAERGLRYHRAVLDAAAAEYETLLEEHKRAPQSITAAQLRRAKLAVELAKAKLEELSE
jgi:hypothetical protein